MFLRREKDASAQRKLEDAFLVAVSNLSHHPVGSDEYEKTLNFVVQLQKLKDSERNPKPISGDTMVNAGTTLLGILMIIRHEWANPITSKALSFIPKLVR